jgi:chromosome segregation and condensation protein ScpB
MNIKLILESLLFASAQPQSEKQLQQLFPDDAQPEISEIKQALQVLAADYETARVRIEKSGEWLSVSNSRGFRAFFTKIIG